MSDHDMDRERRPRVTAVWTAIIALAALLLAVPAARAQDPTGAPDRYGTDLIELPDGTGGPEGRG